MPRPLTGMAPGDTYKGQDGGLYGGGRNTPPDGHLRAALQACSGIRPLDPRGNPSSDGLTGFLSIGFSNVWREFREFIRLSRDDPEKSPAVRAANGAQNHMGIPAWISGGDGHGDPWQFLARRLERAEVAALQVQALWMKLAPPLPASLGDFPKHAEMTKRDLRAVLTRLHTHFPNLRIAYLSSRIYGGYAFTPLNPEPYAYEHAFAIRWLIQDQIRGDPDLNCDPRKGPLRAPLLLWGPYLWADGAVPRKPGELIWTRDDFGADGAHPSQAGAQKVARLLLKFFKTDPTARPWFLRLTK